MPAQLVRVIGLCVRLFLKNLVPRKNWSTQRLLRLEPNLELTSMSLQFLQPLEPNRVGEEDGTKGEEAVVIKDETTVLIEAKALPGRRHEDVVAETISITKTSETRLPALHHLLLLQLQVQGKTQSLLQPNSSL
jgi:hypothetical protein